MRKIIIALAVAFSAIFATSCNIDNTALIGDWDTVVMDASGIYNGETQVKYDLVNEGASVVWHFSEAFLVSVDVAFKGEELTSFTAPFVYKPEKGTLTFLVAKCSNISVTDNVAEFDMVVTGDLMNKFLPEIEAYDSEKKGYNIKVEGKEYLVDKAMIHCQLRKRI